MFGIKNPFAGRSLNPLKAIPSLIPVKKGGGISQLSGTALLKKSTWTPATETKLSLIATGKGPDKLPPVEQKHLEAAAKVSLSKGGLNFTPVVQMANERNHYLQLIDNPNYFPSEKNGWDSQQKRSTVVQALQRIPEMIETYRNKTIESEADEKIKLFQEQKTKDAERSRLVSQLLTTEIKDRVQADHSPYLKGAELAMLTAAVSAAARPVNASPDDVINALNILKDLDLEGAVKNMGEDASRHAILADRLRNVNTPSVSGGAYTEKEEDLAWRIAYKLGSSESAEGFKLLKMLQNARSASNPDSNPPGQVPSAAANAPAPPLNPEPQNSPLAGSSPSVPPFMQGGDPALASTRGTRYREPGITPFEDPAQTPRPPERSSNAENRPAAGTNPATADDQAAQTAPSRASTRGVQTTPALPSDAQIKEAKEHSDVLLRTFLRAGQKIVDGLDWQNGLKDRASPPTTEVFLYGRRQEIPVNAEKVKIKVIPAELFNAARIASQAKDTNKSNILVGNQPVREFAAKNKIFKDLAGKAILGVQQNFEIINETKMLPSEPVPLNWAVNALRNGFESESDPHFTYANGRLNKLLTYIRRAAAPTTVLKAIKRYLLPFKYKSPLDALNSSQTSNGEAFKVAETSRIAHGRAMVDAEKKIAQVMEPSLKRYFDAEGKRYKLNDLSSATSSEERERLSKENQAIVRNAVRYEVMTKWSKLILDGDSASALTESQKLEIDDIVREKLSYINGGNADSLLTVSENLRRILDDETKDAMTTTTLRKLAKEVEFPEDNQEIILDEVSRLITPEKSNALKDRMQHMKMNQAVLGDIFRHSPVPLEPEILSDVLDRICVGDGELPDARSRFFPNLNLTPLMKWILAPLHELDTTQEPIKQFIEELAREIKIPNRNRAAVIHDLAPSVPAETLNKLFYPERKKEKFLAEINKLMTLVETGKVEYARVDMQGDAGKEWFKSQIEVKKKQLDEELTELSTKSAALVKINASILEVLDSLDDEAKCGPTLDRKAAATAEMEIVEKARQQVTNQHTKILAEIQAKLGEQTRLDAEKKDLDNPEKYEVNAQRIFKQAGAQLFKNAELGCQVTLTGGGGGGIDTGAITSLAQSVDVSNMILGAVRPRVTIAASCGKSAVVKMGVYTPGATVFIGTQLRTEGRVGLGVSAVLGLGAEEMAEDVAFGLTVRTDISMGMDYTSAKGVALVVPRLTTGVAREKEVTEEITRTLNTVIDYSPPSGNAPQLSRLQTVMQHHNNTSVNVIGKSREIGASGSVSAGVTAGVTGLKDYAPGGLNLGASANLAAHHRRYTRQHQDTTGFMRTRVSVKAGRRTTVNAGGSIVAGRGFGALGDAQKTEGIDVLGASGDLVGTKADVYKSGSVIRSTMTSIDGEVSPRSFRFVTYANASDFEKAVNEKMGIWAHQMAKRMHPTEYDAGGLRKQAVINATLQRIEAFLKDATTRANPMEEFSQYLELSPSAVKKINELQGMADLMRQAGDKRTAEKLEMEVTRTFESADSWEERFLVIAEHAKEERTSGLMSGVTYAQTHTKDQSTITVK